MRRHVLLVAAIWLAISPAFAQIPAPEPARKWTIESGQSFQASLASYDGTTVLFRMPNGSRAQAPAAKLSADDRDYLAAWQRRQPIKFVLPEVVEDPAAEKFVYRTQHFEFESQGKFNTTLLREVARSFEATYELVKALPWGIEPKPEAGDYFHARLLKDKAEYYNAGAPKNSGGVYKGRDKIFLVPFENIGVKVVGKSYAKTDEFETHTMVHELTHQMMHAWLSFLPQWIVEGTAEYTGNLPLRAGHFRVSAAKNGLRDYVDFLKKRTTEGLPEPYPLEKLFGVTNKQWTDILLEDPHMSHRLYFTSYLLVYYFMHLDAKGDGQLFARYFRDVGDVQREVEKYRTAFEEFKKQPGVETLPDGSVRWRGDLKPPERPAVLASDEARDAFQKKTLQILLDGRSEEDLMKQIHSAYVKLGIRL